MMSRRRFLQAAGGVAAGVLATSRAAAAAGRPGFGPTPAFRPGLPVPSKSQMAWQDAEVGLLYCFDLPVAAGVFARNNVVRKRIDPDLYNPTKLDTDAWLAVAKAAGAGYAVFTATQFSGFMQWQSDLYPYGLKQSKWRGGKGDVVGDFVASCRKAGIKPGLYFSTHRNAWQTVWGHCVDWGRGKGTDKQAAFNRLAERMTRELCSHYGDLLEIWFDAGVRTPQEGGPDVLPIFKKHQPDSVFYHSSQRCDHRWIGNEAGHAGVPCWATMPAAVHSAAWKRAAHRGAPDGPVWSPGMVDVPLRGANRIHDWFWRPKAERVVYTPEQLTRMYCNSVGRNSNLVVGVVIQPDGAVPQPDAPCARPNVQERHTAGGHVALEVRCLAARKHLPVLRRKRVAQPNTSALATATAPTLRARAPAGRPLPPPGPCSPPPQPHPGVLTALAPEPIPSERHVKNGGPGDP